MTTTDRLAIPTLYLWHTEQLAEALEALGRRCGLITVAPANDHGHPPADERDAWLDAIAAQCGIEAEPVRCDNAELDDAVRRAGPALFRLTSPETGDEAIIAVISGGRRVRILTPQREERLIEARALVDAIGMVQAAPLREPIDRLLRRMAIAEERQPRAAQALLRERLAGVAIDIGWLIRPSAGATIWAHSRYFRTWQLLILAGILTIISQVLGAAGWSLIGRQALDDSFSMATVLAWLLLLLTAIPFQAWRTIVQRRIGRTISGIIKLRLLAGAAAQHPDAIRHQGTGAALALLVDADEIDQTAAASGVALIGALTQLASAAAIMLYAVNGIVLDVLLGGWLLVIGLLLIGVQRSSRAIDVARRRLTNELVEAMAGHRTRLAQEDPARWHEREDRALADYIRPLALDWITALLQSAPGLWLIVALAALIPTARENPSATTLGLAIGGIILAQQGIAGIAAAINDIISLGRAWGSIGPVIRTREERVDAGIFSPVRARQPGDPLLSARGLVYRYRPGGQPVLRGGELQIAIGDRILLESPSGGGKSTLAAVIAGLRHPEAGLLLADGFDRASLGAAGWRRRVVMAPQFHENHVFSGTFAFNLLMGRRWPASADDLEDAETLCRELGLGPLLDRMPAGMQQHVGETGWQLSHGERSRLFLARAILQGAPLVILDESAGALDPETLERALACVLQRAPALVLIAHP
ncbi:MAG: ABC transporter ATP-binding protein/permease [Chloroflexi bacterium]|nr:ABC transporter ATP-binding protein/permease [Chloroflexota bacterium]